MIAGDGTIGPAETRRTAGAAAVSEGVWVERIGTPADCETVRDGSAVRGVGAGVSAGAGTGGLRGGCAAGGGVAGGLLPRDAALPRVRRRRPNSLWIYLILLRTQVHSQIKIHSQIDLCRPETGDNKTHVQVTSQRLSEHKPISSTFNTDPPSSLASAAAASWPADLRNSSFLIQSSSFLIHNSSFCVILLQHSSF